MRTIKLLLLSSMIVIISYNQSYSLPRFSLRMDGKCMDCHVNPTGGEMRNHDGWTWSRNSLAMISPHKDFEMTNRLAPNIEFGFDFRGNYLVAMNEAYTKSDFQRMQGSIYTSISLAQKIKAYARYDFIWQFWEAYGLAHILPNNGYIKGGTFMPNYGIRIDDHTAYIKGGDLGVLFATGRRQGLIYDPRYVETGVEIGQYISDFAFVTASIGNPRSTEFNADPTYTARVEFTPEVSNAFSLSFGGSFASFKDQRFDKNFKPIYQNVNMFGGFAGISIDEFVLEGEFDMAKDYMQLDSSTTAMMVQAAYTVMKGVDAVVRYDRFDPNIKLSSDDHSRIVLGLEIQPYSFVEIRPQYRIQMEHPDVKNNSFVAQFHIYY